MDGINVVMSSASELVAIIGGERYVARFLFTPAVLRAGDRVWLRIEKSLDVADKRARKSSADVTARITKLYARKGVKGRDTSVLVKPRTGVSFLMTIDEFGAATPGDEATRRRFDDGERRDPTARTTTTDDAPTEKMSGYDVFQESSAEDTLRDSAIQIARELRWSV